MHDSGVNETFSKFYKNRGISVRDDDYYFTLCIPYWNTCTDTLFVKINFKVQLIVQNAAVNARHCTLSGKPKGHNRIEP